MNTTRLLFLWMALGWLVNVGAARADALDKVDKQAAGSDGEELRVRPDSSGRRAYSASPHRDRDNTGSSLHWADDEPANQPCGGYGEDSCPRGHFALGLLQFTIGLPWLVPRIFDDPSRVGYARRPFADGPGVLRQPADDTQEIPADVRRAALAVDVESGYLLEGAVPGVLGLRLGLPRRFELDARVGLLSDIYEQPVKRAVSATSHVTYRFAQGSRFDFRTGVGVRMFALDAVRAGVDLMYAVDAYIARSVVLRVELHGGTLGQALAAQARSTLGVMLWKAELYAGYDHTVFYRDGSATLGGPIAGLRAWF